MYTRSDRNDPPDSLRQARAYRERYGWHSVPVPYRKKGPVISGWQNLRLSAEELPAHFNGSPQNLGVLLGTPSGGLCDVDLDCREARRLAPYLLEGTLRFGRDSSPRSHWLYKCEPVPETKKFEISAETEEGKPTRETLVELRSTGCQTIFPPSVHPSGEKIEFEDGCPPTEIGGEELTRRVRLLAAACLFLRSWPRNEGARQGCALAMAGALTRSGVREDEAGQMIRAVARLAGDEEFEKRAKAASYANERSASDERLYGWPTVEELFGTVCAEYAQKWLSPLAGPTAKAASSSRKGSEPTQAEKILQQNSDVEFFHTPDGDACASYMVGGALHTALISSPACGKYVRRKYYHAEGRPPSAQALQDACDIMSAKALFDGEEREVHLRVAGHGERIYIDLANENWEVVEISKNGWEIKGAEEVPVRFRRTPGMLAFPTPEHGGTLDLLRSHVRLMSAEEFALLLAWLVQALSPQGPYPALELTGEQGAGKSWTAKILRALLDPHRVPTRTRPREERDLMVAADNGWLLPFDNLSGLAHWLSDALCRLATGGGFGTRKLYTGREEELFYAMRPVILNGIEDLTTRPDLADRAVTLRLEPISKSERKTEKELKAEFEQDRPLILGALFDAVATALRNVDDVELETLPRMADFARWGVAAEEAFPVEEGTFMRAYDANRAEASEEAVANDTVASAIQRMLNEEGSWEGIMSELLVDLKQYLPNPDRPPRDFPDTHQAMTARLRRVLPALRAVGVDREDLPRTSGGRPFRLYWTEHNDTPERNDGGMTRRDTEHSRSEATEGENDTGDTGDVGLHLGSESRAHVSKSPQSPKGTRQIDYRGKTMTPVSPRHKTPPTGAENGFSGDTPHDTGEEARQSASRRDTENGRSRAAKGDNDTHDTHDTFLPYQSTSPTTVPANAYAQFQPNTYVQTPKGGAKVVGQEGRRVTVELDSARIGEHEAFDADDIF